MAHLDEGTVQALLHHELSAEQRARAEEHLVGCNACWAAVRQAQLDEEWVLGRMAVLEDDRASAQMPLWLPSAAPVSPVSLVSPVSRATRGVPWRRAAGLLSLLGGSGALWALPAVRNWVQDAVAGEAPSAVVIPVAVSGSAKARAPEAPSGIALVPGARVVIEVSAGSGGVRARLADRPDVSIAAEGGHAAFETAEGRLRVRPDRGVAIRIEVPQSAPLVEVIMAGRREFVVRAGIVTTNAPHDGQGWYQLPRRE